MPHLPESVRNALSRRSNAALVLTPTDRAAKMLRARYDASQAPADWQPANIFALGTWLRTLWSGLVPEGHETRLLLNAAQEHIVWQQAIQAGPAFESMGTLDALATLAASAWSRAAAFGLSSADLQRAASTHDSLLFAAWARQFEHICHRQEYVSLAELPQALVLHVQQGTLLPPDELLHYGFAPPDLAADGLTPTRTALLDAFGERGTNITQIPAEAHSIPANAVELPLSPDALAAMGESIAVAPSSEVNHPARAVIATADPPTELRTAARWIRHFLERAPASAATPTVALLVPTLAEEALAIESVLREILAPELELISSNPDDAPYAIASSASLAGAPMITAALDLLAWAAASLPLRTVSALLLSPYTAPSETLAARAAFDAFHLCSAPLLRPELDLDTLLKLTSSRSFRRALPAEARTAVQRWHTALSPLAKAKAKTYADWTDTIRAALRDAGWPGDRPLTAAEFALTRAWDHVLDLVATLDFSPARIDFATVLAAIRRAAQQAQVEPASFAAPVQVLTPAEAAGCTFDAVVFLRATDAHWPQPERAHPLLPYSLQRERRMPGADAALTAVRAQQLTAQLAACAPGFVALYAEQDAEGEQRLSPAIATLALHKLTPEELLPPEPPRIPVAEEVIEDLAPIPPLPPGQTRGGASVLELQAACAFHAFAAFRLHASATDSTGLGFDARETGNFVHKALENFWSAISSQATLRAMSVGERRKALAVAIDQAAKAHPPALTDWDAAYLKLQRDRLLEVLMQWLDRELERGPFTVLEREKEREITLGPLTLKLRLDRVDAVGSGDTAGTLLVDYKTGSRGSPKDWHSDRPDAPQLPLYALLPESDDLQGLAFAKIRAGNDMRYHGYAPDGILPAKPRPAPRPFADWEEQRAKWHQVLEQLAQDFFDGDASVSPKDYPRTCTHCAHRLLCRFTGPALDTEEADLLDANDEDGALA